VIISGRAIGPAAARLSRSAIALRERVFASKEEERKRDAFADRGSRSGLIASPVTAAVETRRADSGLRHARDSENGVTRVYHDKTEIR